MGNYITIYKCCMIKCISVISKKIEPRPIKYRKPTKRQESVENSKSRQQALNTCSRKQLNCSKFSRAAEENKISNISHNIYSIETSWLFREELF